jgi:hypothetical protein
VWTKVYTRDLYKRDWSFDWIVTKGNSGIGFRSYSLHVSKTLLEKGCILTTLPPSQSMTSSHVYWKKLSRWACCLPEANL